MKTANAATLTKLFLLLGMMGAVMPLATDMYLPALPEMERDLNASAAAGQLTMATYFVGASIGQLAYGRTSDLFGRRPVFVFGVGVFVISCFGCALAPSLEVMLLLRLFQALGACGATVIARAVIFDLVSAHEGARFLSRLMLIQGIAPILAPMLGGWIVVAFGWRLVFAALGVFGAVLLATGLLVLPETRSREARSVSQGETTVSAYLAILKNWPLMRVSLAGAFGSASFFTYLANAPLLLIDIYGVPPDRFGYYFAVNAVGLIGCAQINRALLSYHPPERILRFSLLASFAISLLLFAGSKVQGMGPWPVLVPLFMLISSFAFVMSNAMALAQGHDPARPGAVAAVSGSVSFGAGALSAGLSGFIADGTASPMAVVIAGATGCAALLFMADRKTH